MNKDLFIITHLGMGDLIITHGAIRKLMETRRPRWTYVLIKESYLETATKMFADLERLVLVTTPAQWLAYANIDYPEDFNGDVLEPWWYNYDPQAWTEDAIYLALGFEVDDRYKYFKIPRNMELEQQIYNEFVGDCTNYIFIHEDIPRGYIVDRSKILYKYDKIVTASDLTKYSLCDLIMILENAKECHTIHSSFAMLIDALGLSQKLFMHEKYIRKLNEVADDVRFLRYVERRGITLL